MTGRAAGIGAPGMGMIDYTLPLDELPDPLPIEPLSGPFDVTITPPGSKSITNRAYVLAALADGESKIIRPLRSDDCDLLLDALCTLGATARWSPDGEDVYITGVNGRFPRGGEVNLGDGGTPTRFMIAAACMAAEPVVVDGSKRMRERPIAEGVDMLRRLGADIAYVEEDGRLPVRISPSDAFKGGEIKIGKTASSQFISALMLIAPWFDQPLKIWLQGDATSTPYVSMTSSVIEAWAPTIYRAVHGTSESPVQARSFWVRNSGVQATEFRIEPDASSAVYWFAAACTTGGRIVLDGLGGESPQPDAACVRHLEVMGGILERACGLAEPMAMHGNRRQLHGLRVDHSGAPDGAMTIAACAAVADSDSHITGLHTLRVKETDRIAALENELRKLGCTVSSTDDSITIEPLERDDAGAFVRTNPVVIETYNDHRMAMAFAILGLVRPGISIANPACVSKSYPTFWQDLTKLYKSQRPD